ncbi:hypothetical protein J437_LFUL018439 [Ladona fulva]|uniref:Uncharacterized protein n=1 Tax=Ladona fulva TaxID=123851 RepID=A0A8K0KX90_LADFU|nr:hypothetical protein J437_LFUL018439 [Ladona fulva]
MMAMGSPHSPAMANLYMESFEERAPKFVPLQPKEFNQYVNNTFLVWPHGCCMLDQFFEHLSNIHPTHYETRKRWDSVYRNPTHIDLYLNNNRHHQTSHRKAELSRLFHCTIFISDKDNLLQELPHLYTIF